MAHLKVVLRGALINEILLNPEKEYIGGRKDGSDIRLQAEKGISREHFKLKYDEGRWKISTLSRFGDVFSLGQKIDQMDLQHGQVFQIPPYEFTLLDIPDAAFSKSAKSAELSTSKASNANTVTSMGKNDKTVVGVEPHVPYIKVMNSNGEVREMLRLEVGQVWVAGRDPSCQIIIADERVSRRQFEIYKVNGAYTILDLGSANGTFLNSAPVSSSDPQTLKSGDVITVLDNTMYFELHDPNFQYKVDRIEVPPLQIEQMEAEGLLGEVSNQIPEIEQGNIQQQLMTTGGPFTGMPRDSGEGQASSAEQNQFYGFQQAPAEEMPVTGFKKLMQNKLLLVTLVLVVLGGAYYIGEMLSATDTPSAVVVGTDPFSKLTPAKQKEVEEYYKLAEQMYNQQKYDLALEKIRKIKEILPMGYKDSNLIEQDAEQANLTLVQSQKDEEARKEKEERDAKNKETIAQCAKLIGPKITKDEMSQCLIPVAEFDPQNNDYIRLMSEAEKIEQDRQQKELEAKNYEQQVKNLNELFAAAEEAQTRGYAFKAIKKYKLVIESNFPDTKKIKEKSRERIKFIERKIKEKSALSISAADIQFKAGNIKGAITILREAKIYDPESKIIQEKIDTFSFELKRLVRTLYQEAVIDENYGIIENTETKEGAKEKWKKITEMDLKDGEYFRKAIIKLHRYGIM